MTVSPVTARLHCAGHTLRALLDHCVRQQSTDGAKGTMP